jgi:hypothetical protein
MISNIALEEDTASRIVELGGVAALTSCLSSTSAITVENTVKTLRRLAAVPSNADQLVRGAIGWKALSFPFPPW